jgi:NADH-quinone oxidoreductase subunit L
MDFLSFLKTAPIAPEILSQSLWMIIALPLLGAFICGVFGRMLGRANVHLVACSAVAGSFILAVLAFWATSDASQGVPSVVNTFGASPTRYALWNDLGTWFSAGDFRVNFGLMVDHLSGTLLLVITGVGFLIHLYSSEYMKDDPSYHRFFAYLNLFCFSMLVLIMADNLALLFVGWEGVGMCSYLLIGFWFGETKNATAGRKAFIVNRIGDFGLLVAMSMLVYYLGTLRFSGIELGASNLLAPVKIWPIGNLSPETLPTWLAAVILPKQPVMVYASTLVGLAVFLGCAGKSAQIPLYIWLPDAMAGPTPVSALIHAATMVTAGVYLVARLGAVFILSPAAMATVAVVGAATALFAASIGLFQRDLKKVLAYSTVSQLGFMFIGVGVGAFASGFFHVFTHAFFKACLFLGAGSVIHAMHARIHDTDKSQDMRNMGGLGKYLPITRATFLISCLAIAGVPPLAGFWSKDEILWKAYSNEILGPRGLSTLPPWAWPSWLGPAIYWVGILAATMTAFYMFRAYFLTFHGEFRGWTIVAGWKDPHAAGHHHDDDHHEEEDPKAMEGPAPHESPLAMTIPLMVLALFAAFAGFLNAELIHVEPLGHLLEPVFKTAETTIHERAGAKGMEMMMLAPGILAFVVGGGAAAYVYLKSNGAQEKAFARAFPRLYRLIFEKWRIDELYEATVIGMVDALADIFQMADTWIVDGVLAKLSAAFVGAAGTVLRALQTGKVQAYSASMVIGLAGVGWFLVRPHAITSIDDTKLRQTGEVTVSASPGFGYSYKWEGPGIVAAAEFTDAREIKIPLQPGDKKEVVLQVRNAFNGIDKQTITVTRPGRKGAAAAPGNNAPSVIEVPPDGKIVIPGDQIPGLIRGHQ